MEGRVRALLAALVAGTLAGCASPQAASPRAPTVTLEPYRTSTVAPVTTSPATVVLLPTAGPSPTARAYSVRANDTFLAIALAYGLTRDELLAANPGINPDLLSIGQQLLIPAPGGQGTATPVPTPTPLALHAATPRCFPTSSGGLWCLLSVANSLGAPVEGLSGLLTLMDLRGAALLTLPLYPPLNIVPAGQTMVLSAYLPPPIPEYESAAAVVAMAVPAQLLEARYLEAEWSVLRSQPSADRRSWEAEVEVRLPPDAQSMGRVAVVALAFDDLGDVIGFIKWEADEEVRPGELTQAALTVFSLGPPIDRIDVLVEALRVP